MVTETLATPLRLIPAQIVTNRQRSVFCRTSNVTLSCSILTERKCLNNGHFSLTLAVIPSSCHLLVAFHMYGRALAQCAASYAKACLAVIVAVDFITLGNVRTQLSRGERNPECGKWCGRGYTYYVCPNDTMGLAVACAERRLVSNLASSVS